MNAPNSSSAHHHHHRNRIPNSLRNIHLHLTSMNKKSFFIFLSIGTIASIGISCAAEEYILKRIEGFHHYWFLALFELVVFSVMTFVWMMITMDNVENGDVKDFGSNTNGVEDVLKSTTTTTPKKKKSSFLYHEYYSRIVPPLKAPIHLYVASASLIGIYTSLGKLIR